MLTLKIAFRNIFRNTRRSLTTLSTVGIGATAVLVFGAYITYIQYGVQTGAVQHTGHLQVFRNGYFNYGTAAPADWGIDHYQDVLRLIREDPELKQLTSVVTPIQSLAGIAGNFENNTSKPFFGTGFVRSSVRFRILAHDFISCSLPENFSASHERRPGERTAT